MKVNKETVADTFNDVGSFVANYAEAGIFALVSFSFNDPVKGSLAGRGAAYLWGFLHEVYRQDKFFTAEGDDYAIMKGLGGGVVRTLRNVSADVAYTFGDTFQWAYVGTALFEGARNIPQAVKGLSSIVDLLSQDADEQIHELPSDGPFER